MALGGCVVALHDIVEVHFQSEWLIQELMVFCVHIWNSNK